MPMRAASDADKQLLADFCTFLELRVNVENAELLRRVLLEAAVHCDETLVHFKRFGANLIAVLPFDVTDAAERTRAARLLHAARPGRSDRAMAVGERALEFVFARVTTKNLETLWHIFRDFCVHSDATLAAFVQLGAAAVSIIPYEPVHVVHAAALQRQRQLQHQQQLHQQQLQQLHTQLQHEHRPYQLQQQLQQHRHQRLQRQHQLGLVFEPLQDGRAATANAVKPTPTLSPLTRLKRARVNSSNSSNKTSQRHEPTARMSPVTRKRPVPRATPAASPPPIRKRVARKSVPCGPGGSRLGNSSSSAATTDSLTPRRHSASSRTLRSNSSKNVTAPTVDSAISSSICIADKPAAAELQMESRMEPQADPQTEHHTDPQMEPQTEPQTEPQMEPQTEYQVERQVELQGELQDESQVELQMDPQTESQVETQVERPVELQAELQDDSQVEPEMESQLKPQAEPQVELQATPQAESQVRPQAEPHMEPEEVSQVEPEANFEALPQDVAAQAPTLAGVSAEPPSTTVSMAVPAPVPTLPDASVELPNTMVPSPAPVPATLPTLTDVAAPVIASIEPFRAVSPILVPAPVPTSALVLAPAAPVATTGVAPSEPARQLPEPVAAPPGNDGAAAELQLRLEVRDVLRAVEARAPWRALLANVPLPFDAARAPLLARKLTRFWQACGRSVWERHFWAPELDATEARERKARQRAARVRFDAIIADADAAFGLAFFAALDAQRHVGWWYRSPILDVLTYRRAVGAEQCWRYVESQCTVRFPDCGRPLPLRHAPYGGALRCQEPLSRAVWPRTGRCGAIALALAKCRDLHATLDAATSESTSSDSDEPLADSDDSGDGTSSSIGNGDRISAGDDAVDAFALQSATCELESATCEHASAVATHESVAVASSAATDVNESADRSSTCDGRDHDRGHGVDCKAEPAAAGDDCSGGDSNVDSDEERHVEELARCTEALEAQETVAAATTAATTVATTITTHATATAADATGGSASRGPLCSVEAVRAMIAAAAAGIAQELADVRRLQSLERK